MKPAAVSFFVASWCIVLAEVKFHHIWPYQASKIAIFIACIYLCICAHGRISDFSAGAIGVVGIMFNPIIPIHFVKDAWRYIDWLAFLIFMISVIEFLKLKKTPPTGRLT